MLLHDRARVSQKNNWMDEYGRVYVVFPIEALSQKTVKCKSSVKKALKELDDAGLLIRKFGGFSRPRHMYVMLPDEAENFGKAQLQTDVKKADEELKNKPSCGWNDSSTKAINMTPNKVIEKNSIRKAHYLKQENITDSVHVNDRSTQKRHDITKKKNTGN